MTQPLMPKATAVWLVDNTTLTFTQIAAFCELHELEIQAIADGEVAVGMQGLDPVGNGQLTREEIDRCVADKGAHLQMEKSDRPVPQARQTGPRYTPIAKRQDKPDAIWWLVRQYPEVTDPMISRLIGTTKPTIKSVRERTHWNTANLKPRSPVELGLCTQHEMTLMLRKAGVTPTKSEADRPRIAPAEEKKVAPEAPVDELTAVFGTPAPQAE